MTVRNLKQRSVPLHDFSMNPSPEVPRSSFRINQGLKTAFQFSSLIPLYVHEVLPGDHWNMKLDMAARTAVPIVPIMDNWHMDFFGFFTPSRLVWTNWVRMQGEQNDPGDSISFVVPTVTSPAGGFAVNSIYDYMGLPTVGQVGAGATITVNALPLRCYGLINDQWFRDENLMPGTKPSTGDGPDLVNAYGIYKRGKRFDYFTAALPWPQKGNTAVSLPLGQTAPVVIPASVATGNSVKVGVISTTNARQVVSSTAGTGTTWGALAVNTTDFFADLSQATAATVNQLRTSISIQQLLEKDARGGTRYQEILWQHFRVKGADARLQRPEYIGGGSIPIITNAIPQTSATGLTGATTPIGTLAATGSAAGRVGFGYAATEHGYIIIIGCARADLTYSQGMHKMWSRSTRYDFYLPVLQGLGEQAIYNREIYCDGSANDANVFGYIPRWDEYRSFPSKITGLQRPTTTGNIAYWHSSQQFSALPTLNATFITDDAATVVQRNFAAGSLTANQQIIADMMLSGFVARSMPTHGIPGLKRF